MILGVPLRVDLGCFVTATKGWLPHARKAKGETEHIALRWGTDTGPCSTPTPVLLPGGQEACFLLNQHGILLTNCWSTQDQVILSSNTGSTLKGRFAGWAIQTKTHPTFPGTKLNLLTIWNNPSFLLPSPFLLFLFPSSLTSFLP